MSPGMTLSATTASGKMVVAAVDEFTRSYTWEGATRSAELSPRPARWYGSLGAYFPGPGDHWALHNGITRGVLEEGQQRFRSVAEALRWIKGQSWQPCVYRNDGLFVGWGKVLERRQLDVSVFQIYVMGKKPTHLPGSHDGAIVVRRAPAPRESLPEAVRRNDGAMVRRLLGRKANPNVRNAAGLPVLALAAERGYRAVVAALLDAGADPNAAASGGEGATPLLLAAHVDVAGLLLRKGAHPDAVYARGILKGKTRLMSAAMMGDDPMVATLLGAGAKPELAAADGETALHLAATMGNVRVAETLIEHGAPIDPRDELGRTPLMDAVMMPSAQSLALVRLLIAKGADVNARLDATRLEYARARFDGDKTEISRIERSGRLDAMKEDGPSILRCARSEEVRALLRAAGARDPK